MSKHHEHNKGNILGLMYSQIWFSGKQVGHLGVRLAWSHYCHPPLCEMCTLFYISILAPHFISPMNLKYCLQGGEQNLGFHSVVRDKELMNLLIRGLQPKRWLKSRTHCSEQLLIRGLLPMLHTSSQGDPDYFFGCPTNSHQPFSSNLIPSW